jgi:hypothetical protein
MPIEPKRGCGYRKVGGLYLVGTGISVPCDMLPLEIKECECCGYEIPFTRAFLWLRRKYIIHYSSSHDKLKCSCIRNYHKCPICTPEQYNLDKYGLMWVGSQYYTPESFIKEAQTMGVSKRIAKIPKDLKLGETWVLLAHPKVPFNSSIQNTPLKSEPVYKKAIFYAFIPQRIEMLIWKSEATTEKIRKLEEQGITPIIVDDSDPENVKAHKEDRRVIWE